MPIFAYFAVVAPALLGLLFVVGAMMGPPGPMPLTTGATGLPMAYVAPKATPVLTVREGIVADVPKGSNTYSLASTDSAASAQPDAKPVKTKVAKAQPKKKAPQQQVAQFGWQQNQNQPFGGWDQQQPKRTGGKANRNGSGGRYAMSGQQPFLSPFGTIR